MSEINFNYQTKITVIQRRIDDLMKDICQKFADKNQININEIYFIYNGNTINENYTFAQQANSEDNIRNKMNILVNKYIDQTNNPKVKSNEKICSECK